MTSSVEFGDLSEQFCARIREYSTGARMVRNVDCFVVEGEPALARVVYEKVGDPTRYGLVVDLRVPPPVGGEGVDPAGELAGWIIDIEAPEPRGNRAATDHTWTDDDGVVWRRVPGDEADPYG